MTISSSLSAGVSGLAANAHRLATISDNIANSATYGYRRAVTDFHSLVLGNESGRYVAGGVSTTDTRHIEGNGDRAGIRTVRDDSAWEQSIDGNTVEMDTERVAFADNTVHYEAGLTVMSAKIRTMLSAIQN